MLEKIRFILIIFLLPAAGCASGKVYVDADKVPGLGAVVQFPTGKVTPIQPKRVISGNLIELSNGEKVSYIGVYIPELYNIAQSARALNEKLIKENEIRLEFDERQRDSHGRLLAYVFTTKGIFINAEIIRKGLGKALASPPNTKYKDVLLQAENEARQSGEGLWSKDFKK